MCRYRYYSAHKKPRSHLKVVSCWNTLAASKLGAGLCRPFRKGPLFPHITWLTDRRCLPALLTALLLSLQQLCFNHFIVEVCWLWCADCSCLWVPVSTPTLPVVAAAELAAGPRCSRTDTLSAVPSLLSLCVTRWARDVWGVLKEAAVLVPQKAAPSPSTPHPAIKPCPTPHTHLFSESVHFKG